MAENNFYQIHESKIYKGKLDNGVCQQSKKFIESFKDKFTEHKYDCPLKTSHNLTNNILNIVELRQLKFNILSHIDNYMLQTKRFFDGYIYNSWINIYEKNYYQEFHNHQHEVYKCISGVVYLTEKNSNIILDANHVKNFIPEFSDIIIFEDDMFHRVKSNEEELRISLAFNYRKCVSWHGIRETNKEKTND